MAVSLPAPIARYFAADGTRGADVADCFTSDAVVVDERRTHRGREAIARWKSETSTQYQYTVEPIAIDADGEALVVTAHLAGTFPGSPIDLRYRFTLADDAIARLEIAP